MSHTAPATSPSSPNHATQASTRPTNAQGQSQRAQAPADLFATLLALASDGAPTDALPGEALGAEGEPIETSEADATPTDNPLAGLLLWQPPAPDAPLAAPRAAADGHAAPDTSALPPAEHAEAREGQAVATTDTPTAAPTGPTRPQGPSWQVAATRAAQNSAPASAAGGSETPALRWSRATPDVPNQAPAWGVRSTVTMDPRFPGAPGTPGAQVSAAVHHAQLAERGEEAANALPGERPLTGTGPAAGALAGTTGSTDLGSATNGAGDGASDGAGADAGSDSGATPGEENPQAFSNQDADAVEVQHWGGAHGLRHASLRVGEEAARAIDIQLALRGDEVQLDIRTDDSATRDALREHAQAALGERLQQGGLQLGNVSVGAQQQQERQREQALPALSARRAPGAEAAEPATARRPEAAGRAAEGGIDLFA